MRRGTSGINALIALNKPTGMTSHDCVARVRKCVGEKRVGHAGTLDPAASGVLVVGIGQGTRLMGQLTQDKKGYLARISFGSETTTDDGEGEVVREASVPKTLKDENFARLNLKQLEGCSMQVPPSFSAISVAGQRAYTRARRGESVELEARPIEIFKAELLSIEVPEAQANANSQVPAEISWLVSFEVSKGTYIRAIARDLGRCLGTAAHLSALTRTFSGNISLSDCIELSDLEKMGWASIGPHVLNPASALDLPVLYLDDAAAADIACGKRLSVKKLSMLMQMSGLAFSMFSDGDKVSMVAKDKLLGIWRRSGASFVCDVNYPAGVMGVRQ